jgi:hypothetical protein
MGSDFINITVSGSYHDTESWLRQSLDGARFKGLEHYAQMGVDALKAATPIDTAKTADSWYYEIVERSGYYSIRWHNSHATEQGDPIAILLQYGHATGSGGYVEGRDYIMPAITPIFDQIEQEVFRILSQK